VEFKDQKQALEAFATVMAQDLQMMEIVGESYLGQFTSVDEVKPVVKEKVKINEEKPAKKKKVKEEKPKAKKAPKKEEPKYTDDNMPSDSEISEMKKPDLLEVIASYKLDVKVSKHRSLVKLQTAVSEALDKYEDEKTVEEKPEESDDEFDSDIEEDFDVELGDVEDKDDEFDISDVKESDIGFEESDFSSDDDDEWE